MIAELMAANAAFAVIKEAVQNSGELVNAGQALFSYFDNKNAIQKKYQKKAKSSNSNDIEEFMALEQLKKQEEELKQMMIYHGRGGLWDDWLKFQAEAKKKRVEAEKAEIRKSIARKAKVVAVIMWGVIASIISVIIVMVLWMIDQMRYR